MRLAHARADLRVYFIVFIVFIVFILFLRKSHAGLFLVGLLFVFYMLYLLCWVWVQLLT